jgi:hypothetical protein
MAQIFMITETLFVESQARRLCHINISDSALKVVFTTLYVDVKEPALAQIQATKKLNLVPTIIHVSVNHGRDKIESNLQSQMYAERTP